MTNRVIRSAVAVAVLWLPLLVLHTFAPDLLDYYVMAAVALIWGDIIFYRNTK